MTRSGQTGLADTGAALTTLLRRALRARLERRIRVEAGSQVGAETETERGPGRPDRDGETEDASEEVGDGRTGE
jgi:hypothetical protein